MISEEQCWKARDERDPAFDGRFFIGVVSTGIYCRPSCPSRRALRRNIRFYQTAAEAEKAGLRPCLRCRPLESPSAAIQDLCRFIEQHSAEPLDLTALAAHTGLSRFHLQRTFKARPRRAPLNAINSVGSRHAWQSPPGIATQR